MMMRATQRVLCSHSAGADFERTCPTLSLTPPTYSAHIRTTERENNEEFRAMSPARRQRNHKSHVSWECLPADPNTISGSAEVRIRCLAERFKRIRFNKTPRADLPTNLHAERFPAGSKHIDIISGRDQHAKLPYLHNPVDPFRFAALRDW